MLEYGVRLQCHLSTLEGLVDPGARGAGPGEGCEPGPLPAEGALLLCRQVLDMGGCTYLDRLQLVEAARATLACSEEHLRRRSFGWVEVAENKLSCV